ncbi:MAG: hypothetical protein M9888_01910 [Chitinophagales bacterium]|nr:hypothetical protein [Chitinophagales bacterium]
MKVRAQSELRVPTYSDILKDTGAKAYLKDVEISGNKITKKNIIVWETGFSIGDSVPVSNISSTLERIRLNLLNTKLFTNVLVNIKDWDDLGLVLSVTVSEKWYIIPIPIFQLADRNINEWWVDRNKDFKRIQYGLTLNWSNFRGRNENLIISGSLGFAQLLDIQYLMPNLSKNDKIGAAFKVSMMQTKRMPYNTVRDKLKFYYSDDIIKRAIDVAPRIIFHRNINVQYYIEAQYSYRWVDKKIRDLNKDYFLDSNNSQSVVALEYGFDIDKRTLKAYPTSGFQIKGSFKNYGLGLQRNTNLTIAKITGSKFFTLDKRNKHSTGHLLQLQGSFPKKQPYNLQSGLGYEQDFVRGYEYYVIDGQSYALFKNEYRFHFASWKWNFNKKKKSSTHKPVLPFDFYLKAFFDGGYVDDDFFSKNNTLRNQWMLGTGIGLDILLMYDKIVRLEYSLNRRKEHGFFIHLEMPF